MMQSMKRCDWSEKNDMLRDYHDSEWGVFPGSDRVHFETLSLEVFQSGLSWETVLKKREAFRETFCNFDPALVGKLDDDFIREALNNPEIIRHKGKISATLQNARMFCDIVAEYGSFADFLYSIPSLASEAGVKEMHAQLKKRGFSYVGITTARSYLETCGVLNGHAAACFRYNA